ncbi:type VI secretion system tube protein Hcp [Chelatococcus sp. XZ-Ab1]|uniref:Hcp family type VI secretion system effector n=1 Tax=Chelatococcus sp. XZ-Ab1 TaxID=3034027 RepID=UPI0023E3A1EC|nr:type VI secretion system tube protein Hcp [Chelatococcus sp. XZ-Ab1]
MASVDYFLKLDGIKGESHDDKHKEEIDILSFSWGASQSGTAHYGGGAGAGKVQLQDIVFTMRMNKASPTLYLKCAKGEHIPKGKLTVRKAGGKQEEYLVYEFEDIIISSINTAGHDSAESSIPMEQLALNFAKVKMTYKEQKADGSLGAPVEFKWDAKKNISA